MKGAEYSKFLRYAFDRDASDAMNDESSTVVRRSSVLGLSWEQLEAWFSDRGLPSFRAEQVRRWLFTKKASAFDQMTDLPVPLRSELNREFSCFSGTVIEHAQSRDDTSKLLVRWSDNTTVECVLIRENGRSTACISTQVGCAMGCVFCATGLDGVVRNLTTAEIVEQLLRLNHLLGPSGQVDHIVVMGMGEPLANLDSLLPALRSLNQKGGWKISSRRITISTVGIPGKIKELARNGNPYHLAISLHAPDDDLRDQLVPVSLKLGGIDSILEAGDFFFQSTGRQVTYEYVLLGEINDQSGHARRLVSRLAGRKTHVNLIPYNPVKGLDYQQPSKKSVLAFSQILRSHGISVTTRKRKGVDISAACGQLRRTRSRLPVVSTSKSISN